MSSLLEERHQTSLADDDIGTCLGLFIMTESIASVKRANTVFVDDDSGSRLKIAATRVYSLYEASLRLL
jgi:hypothetical protein